MSPDQTTDTNATLAKKEYRRKFLTQRQSLSEDNWQTRSDRLCANLSAMAEFKAAQSILAFVSFRQEPDLSRLYDGDRISATPRTNDRLMQKRWGFPRCIGKELSWHQYNPKTNWVSGAYGIQEPSETWPNLPLAEVDVILVPAVACDRRGSRLGYGGGFYDRCLVKPELQTAITIGIVFDEFRCDQLPQEPWDRALDFVCTDAGVFPCGTSRKPPSQHQTCDN